MGARNKAGIGMLYRLASLCSLTSQFQTRFLELIPRHTKRDLSFRLSTPVVRYCTELNALPSRYIMVVSRHTVPGRYTNSDSAPDPILELQMDLKEQCHEICDFRFFYESVSSKPLTIPLGPFRIFSKFHGDIRNSRCITSVLNTGGI
jgi:hypothetical protein